MFFKSIIWCSKALAITALFLTFPPIFRLAKAHALLISFALTLFYFGNGLLSLLVDANVPINSKLKDWNNSLNMLELPLFLAVIYGSTVFLPSWIAKPYEWFLICTNPVFTILEGMCVSLVVYCIGKYFMYYAKEWSFILKVFVLVSFAIGFAASSLVIINVYLANCLDAITATLIGSTVTLALVLVTMTLALKEGAVLDGLLIYFYVTYNIWIISKSFVRTSSKFYLASYSLEFSSIISWLVPNSAVFSGFTAFLRLFRVEVIFGILFRVCVFVVAAKFFEKIRSQQAVESSFGDDFNCNDLLLAFGKCFLVMIYTYAWLQETDVAIGSTGHIWRWICIYLSMGMFTRNLLNGIEFDINNQNDSYQD